MGKKYSVASCRQTVDKAKELLQFLQTIVTASSENLAEIQKNINAVRRDAVYATLAKYEIERINYNADSFWVKTLRDAGYTTVLSVFIATEQELEKIKGISGDSAKKIKAVAKKIASTVWENTEINLSFEHHSTKDTQLLKSLYFLLHGSKTLRRASVLYKAAYKAVENNVAAAELLCVSWTRLFLLRKNRITAESALEKLEHWLLSANAQEIPSLYTRYQKLRTVYDEAYYWEDFRKYSIQYYTLLETLDKDHKRIVVGEFGLDTGLQGEIDAVQLDLTGLKTQLRSFQRFGVQYIINQKNVLLGDEMGLGKTLQAISAMLHLKNKGATHFIVVCPAGLLINWCREIVRFSDLNAIQIHGRDVEALKRWEMEGGVAVTTYETLQNFDIAENALLAMLVVDEAHYVINPQAQRTQNVGKLREKAQRILYLTGTPLINKVEEMCFLIECLQPDVAKVLRENGFADPDIFRRILMPVYIRRTREMVLTQLPELTLTNVWCEMGEAELEAYKKALEKTNNLADLRRISWSSPDANSASKVLALKEICSRAEREGRKVLVFSSFLLPLEVAQAVLGSKCVGILSGEVGKEQRDELVHKLNEAPAGSVLLGQIQAMGVGLNIQSASVVVLCEPQFTPASEDQAIARSHRMGQVNCVHAYRLVCVDSFDERVLEILEQKRGHFNDYADKSAVGTLSVTDQDITDAIIKEKKRWGIKQ